MKKRFGFRLVPVALILTTILCFTIKTNAQNVVVAGALVGNGSYPTLADGFNAINGGAQTGATILVSIVGNTTETVTATLNQGAWTLLTISPSGGVPRSITGNIAGSLVNLDGADRVVVNGLNSGGNSLTFDNSNNTSASTMQFINDARLNLVQNCSLLGSNTSATSGTVFISTSAGGGGNDSLSFNACTLDASGINLPIHGIYSDGTVGQENSSILINNCNVANYFSASAVSRGIFVNTNNAIWTVSSCRFYQSATRTYTTANTHRALQIASGDNHSIVSNTIGYATSAGTGTYTMTGTIATRFIGIEMAAGTAVASSIQGNLVRNISLNTSSAAATTYGVLCGISVTSGQVNIGTVAGNIIGSTSGVDALVAIPTASNGAVVGIHSSSTGVMVIQNNSIGGFTSSGVTAAVAGGIIGINVSGVASSMSILNNTIGNTTANNMRGGTSGLTTGSSQVVGITLPSTPTVSIVSNNTIQNLSSYGTGTAGYVRGISTQASTAAPGTHTITNNFIFALTTDSRSTALTNGYASANGIAFSSGVNSVVANNTIYNISNISASTNASYVVGIASANNTAGTIRNNTIYDLFNAGTSVTATAPSIVAGIAVRSGTTNNSIYNNMISIGGGSTSNTAFVGILLNHGSTPDPIDQIYHNTINISGTVGAGAIASFGIHRGDFTATTRNQTVDIKNNLITNTRTGGTGSHYAIGNNSNATSGATGWASNASNNNVLNATAGTVGYWGAALDFANWKAASNSDVNSYSGISVTYVSSVNLRLNMGLTPTSIESGGQTIAAVTSDIDADVRPGPVGSVNGGAFSPDIGADEFDGVYLDANAPVISYTPLTFTCSTGDRTLTATIVDFTGVPTVGGLMPRIYFRKNAGTWYSSAGTLASGSVTNGSWSFTIAAATVGGLVVGDLMEYFVIAQDLAVSPNISSLPALGLVASDVNTVTTAPTTPNSYLISDNLSGTYTVGAAGAYTTITAAATAYNTSCLAGPVIFELIDAIYPSESFPIVFNSNSYASAVNTLTIQPAVGVSPAITGSSATSILQISGGDFITINGSNSGLVNSLCPEVSASRDLSITNSNASTASAVVSINTISGDAATNNAVMNCIITGNGSNTTLVGVHIGGTTIGSGTGSNGNNFNQVVNNLIQQAQVGIFSAGASAALKNANNVFDLNDMNSSGTSALGRIGIALLFEDQAMVRSNNIGNILNTGSVDIMGITLGYTAFTNTSGATGAAEVTNALVNGNQIDNLVQSNTYSAAGIVVATTSDTNTVSNNMINGVFCNGTGGDFGVGIYYTGGTGLLNVYHNTVNVGGAALTGATQPNIAMGINGTTPNVDIRNNIFTCSGSNGFDGNTGIGLGYTSTTGAYVNLLSDYNDIFVSGTNSYIGRTGGLAGGTTWLSLLDWQTETGADMNSVNINPTYVSGTDAHIVVGSNAGIENAGTPLASVTEDIDCETRTSTPDMGADEVCNLPTTPIVGASPLVICEGETVTLSLSVGMLNDATDWYWYEGSCGGTLIGTGSSITVSPSTTTTYFVRAEGGCVIPSTCESVTITVNPSPIVGYIADPSEIICAGTALTLYGTGAITYDWTGGVSDGASFVPTASGPFVVTGTDGSGCSNTATANIVVNPNPTVNLGTDIVQVNPPAVLDAGAGFSSYLWSTTENTQTISVTTNGSYIVTVSNGAGCTDSDTIQVSFTAGILNLDGSIALLSMYPNPSTSMLYLSIENMVAEHVITEILDVNGKLVLSSNPTSVNGNQVITYNVEELPNGLYLLRFTANGQSSELRFVKQ